MKMNVMRPCIPVMKMHFVTTQLGHLSAFVKMVLKEMIHTAKISTSAIVKCMNVMAMQHVPIQEEVTTAPVMTVSVAMDLIVKVKYSCLF
ncbi:Hypothetical predicted protein [Paramuricea clavata]|uniref:Uncharacterized protein n=1 Tax=Paramuricea clavata TaxID=317549 RepID=A0A6S7I3W2_PARCT|nr:Hypothetical predicted protein [Paramuricea clavata]